MLKTMIIGSGSTVAAVLAAMAAHGQPTFVMVPREAVPSPGIVDVVASIKTFLPVAVREEGGVCPPMRAKTAVCVAIATAATLEQESPAIPRLRKDKTRDRFG